MHKHPSLLALLLLALAFGATPSARADDAAAQEDDPDIPTEVQDVDVAPEPIRQDKPSVPPELAGVKASVVVAFVIDESGCVVDEHIVRSTNPAFDQIALDCVRGWEYKPAIRAGAPVKVRVVIPIRFNMSGRFR
jgi:TonB family protein